MRQRFFNFMQGRYGADSLSKFLMIVLLVFWFLSVIATALSRLWLPLFIVARIFNALSWIIIIFSLFRMFSKNINKRYAENVFYLKKRNQVITWFNNKFGNNTHKIFPCPNCKQKIRVPRHKGRIAIRCPKCGREFIKRT